MIIGTHVLPRRVVESVGTFSGRTWVLPRLLQWWDREAARLFLLTGGPGTGKSMLMAWLAGLGAEPSDPAAVEHLTRLRSLVKAAHFCQASSQNTSPRAFAQGLANQLTASVPGFADALAATLGDRVQIVGTAHAGTAAAGSTVTGLLIQRIELGPGGDSFDAAFTQPLTKLYERGHTAPILLLVDSLDEAQTYREGTKIVDRLSRLEDLPAGVRILATSRDTPEVRKFLRGVPGLDLNDASDNAEDLRDYIQLRLATLTSVDEHARAAFATRLAQHASGVFLYAAVLLDDLARRPSSELPDLDTWPLPAGLAGIYREFLVRPLGNQTDTWIDHYEPILGLLAVARDEGLTTRQLSNIVGRDVRRPLQACKQYLAGEWPDGPFRPFHQSFVDFLLEATDENVDFRIDGAAMHRRLADYYWSLRDSGWIDCDAYGRRNLALHIREAGQPRRLDELIARDWMAARYEAEEYTHDGFVADVDLAWSTAQDEPMDETAIVRGVRYALLRSSINSISQSHVAALVARALEEGVWTAGRAFALASRLRDTAAIHTWTTILATQVLTAAERREARDRAVAAGRGIRKPQERAAALIALLPHLDGDLRADVLDEALEAARRSEYIVRRVELLSSLASHLYGAERERVLHHAVDAAGEMAAQPPSGDARSRGDAMLRLATLLPEELAVRAVEIADALEATPRLLALSALAFRLPPDSRGPVVDEVVEAVERGLEGTSTFLPNVTGLPGVAVLTPFDCLQILPILTAELSGEARDRLLRASLDAVSSAQSGPRYQLFTATAPLLDANLARLALPIARNLDTVETRARGLAALVSRLSAAESRDLLSDVRRLLHDASPVDRLSLAAWVAHAEGASRHELLADVLATAATIAPVAVAQLPVAVKLEGALHLVFPHLTPDLVRPALELALDPACRAYRAGLLGALAPHLKGESLARALDAPAIIEDEPARVAAMGVLSARLTDPAKAELLEYALATAMSIKYSSPRAEALAHLAPRLSSESRRRALVAGLQATRDAWPFEDSAFRKLAPELDGDLVNLAMAIAQQFPEPAKRAAALVALAPVLTGEAKAQLVQEALNAAVRNVIPTDLARSIEAIVPLLDERQRQVAWAVLQLLDNFSARVSAMAAIARVLSGDQQKDAIQASYDVAAAISWREDRLHALAAVIPQLTGDTKRHAVHLALEAAAAIERPEGRLRALVVLAPELHDAARIGVLGDALDLLDAQTEYLDDESLARLAPLLSRSLLERAVAIAERVPDHDRRVRSLAALIRPVLAEAPGGGRRTRLRMAARWLFSLQDARRPTMLGFVSAVLSAEGLLTDGAIAEIARTIREVVHDWRFYPSVEASG
jgi:hypothetical protein